MNKSIYIKPSKRKCSMSDFKCFDIFGQDKKKIGMIDCDVIDIRCPVMLEVVDGMIHIWSHKELKINPLICTLIIEEKKQ